MPLIHAPRPLEAPRSSAGSPRGQRNGTVNGGGHLKLKTEIYGNYETFDEIDVLGI